jgi:CO dehydrogenase maturation factor
MAEIIVSTGRGGTGKSTFTTLAAYYLQAPTLLIDLDPDESLADMLGYDLSGKGISTISDKLYEILEASKSTKKDPDMSNDSMLEVIENECLYRGEDGVDLVVLGAKLTKGCYCIPDDVLKNTIPRMMGKYAHVVIDSPAGLEHLNRKVVSDVDDFFVILDPSSKSLQHIGRIRDIARELSIAYRNFYLVANYAFDDEQQAYFQDSGENFLGKIESDPDVADYNLSGKSLLSLPADSPALLSVGRILGKTAISTTKTSMS